MKRMIVPLLCSLLLGVWSCNMEDTFSMTNVEDLVTVTDGRLVNDYGAVYTVNGNDSDIPEWKVEGARYYMVFDILNRQLEIDIHGMMEIRIQQALPKTMDAPGHDPVILVQQSISGGYVNLGLGYYRDTRTETAHPFEFRYEMEGNNLLHLYMYHDGSDENPTAVSTDNLKTQYRFYSIPVSDFNPKSIDLTLDVLTQDADGKFLIEQRSVNIY